MTVLAELAVAVTVCAALLAVGAGVAKLARPSGAAAALAAVGVRGGVPLVRALAVLELVVGTAALATGWWATRVLLAVLYLGFAGFVVASLRAGSTAACGCFGDPAGAPLSRRHLAVDLMLALGALGALGAHRPLAVAGSTSGRDALVLVAVGTLSALLTATALRWSPR